MRVVESLRTRGHRAYMVTINEDPRKERTAANLIKSKSEETMFAS
jgi:hypothetical protein